MNVLRGLNGSRCALDHSRHFARSLATPSTAAAAADKEEDGNPSGLFSSWVGKIKGAFKGSTHPQPEQQLPPPPVYTFIACADELKSARHVSKLTSFLKKQPRVPEGAVSESLEKCETIMRALAKHDPTGQNVDEKHKEAVAKECGCNIQEVNKILTKFEWMKEARAKLLQMKEKGEELPKTMGEVEKLLNGTALKRNLSQSRSAEMGRNAPCSCGSGKKYKRCCGRGT